MFFHCGDTWRHFLSIFQSIYGTKGKDVFRFINQLRCSCSVELSIGEIKYLWPQFPCLAKYRYETVYSLYLWNQRFLTSLWYCWSDRDVLFIPIISDHWNLCHTVLPSFVQKRTSALPHIYWSVWRNNLASSEQTAGDLEVAKRSLLRPVLVGLCCIQISGSYHCLNLFCTALADVCTFTWSSWYFQHADFFFLYCKHAQRDSKSMASVCAQPRQTLCLSLKDVKLIITKEHRGKTNKQISTKWHPLWFPICIIPFHAMDWLFFFWNITVYCWEYRPSPVIPAFLIHNLKVKYLVKSFTSK